MACPIKNENDKVFSDHDKNVLNQIFNPGLPYGDEVEEEVEENNDESGIDAAALRKAKELEVAGVRAAEAGQIDSAVDLFSQACAAAPGWPSAYNNRAQALRLRGDQDGAARDLDRALELSGGVGPTATQAYTQRGLLRKKNGDEEGARKDLESAARGGGAFAKQLLAAMNPYAALCNQMLGDVMTRLRSGQPDA